MKCKYCDGTGYVKTISVGGVPCSACNGTGEVEPFDLDAELDRLYPQDQTEEEWLKSLDTKQLAKWIDNLLMRCLCRDCNFCPIHKAPHCTCEGIEEWLKQSHKEQP